MNLIADLNDERLVAGKCGIRGRGARVREEGRGTSGRSRCGVLMGMKLTLGDTVKPYGKVVAVGKIEGEEYYWFIDKHGSVAMIPAVAVEKPEVEG